MLFLKHVRKAAAVAAPPHGVLQRSCPPPRGCNDVTCSLKGLRKARSKEAVFPPRGCNDGNCLGWSFCAPCSTAFLNGFRKARSEDTVHKRKAATVIATPLGSSIFAPCFSKTLYKPPLEFFRKDALPWAAMWAPAFLKGFREARSAEAVPSRGCNDSNCFSLGSSSFVPCSAAFLKSFRKARGEEAVP